MTSITQRHAILTPEQASTANEFFERTFRANDNSDYRQCLVLTYDPHLLDASYLAAAERKLSGRGIDASIHEWKGMDAGRNLYRAIDMGDEINYVISADDFRPDDEKVIKILGFMDKLLQTQHIAAGQRSRIPLSTDPVLQQRREIQEMFYVTLFPDVVIHNPLGVEPSLPSAYAKYGDRFSAFYGLNKTSQKTQAILNRMSAARRTADMDGSFAPDYYMMMLASESVPVDLVYVPVENGNMGSNRSERSVNTLIQYSTRQLLRTDIGHALKTHVENPRTVELLAETYPMEEIRAVRDTMLWG
jgi:hypothetical protein